MSDHSIWILGYGLITISKQFYVDLPRIQGMTINNIPLTSNIYIATRLLYDICGIHYYHYSRYMNQTLGNLMIFYMKKMYSDLHLIPEKNTYEVQAWYKLNRMVIRAAMRVKLYNSDLSEINTIRISCVYNVQTNNTTISLSII